tara:strand:+ start:100 stop:564 length:465 start_codon:yes stop_codon:yes gene_type:complete
LRNYTELRATIVEGRKISGIAVPYNKTSHLIRDRARPYRERFLKGALKIDDNVALYISHDHRSIPLARVGAGTLSFTETEEGLMFEAILPENRTDVIEAVARGDIGGVSIGFNKIKDKWTHRRNNSPSDRVVEEAVLLELSLVAAGAYPDATIF